MDDSVPPGHSVGCQKVFRSEKTCTQVSYSDLQRLHQLFTRVHQYDFVAVVETFEQTPPYIHGGSRIWQEFIGTYIFDRKGNNLN